MARFGRLAEATSFDVTCIDRPFSNFDFVEKVFPRVGPLRRILSQVRQHGGRSMVIEELRVSGADDLRQEDEDIRTRHPSFQGSRCFRLSFFNRKISTRKDLARVSGEPFLGYAIIKDDDVPSVAHVVRVYESVLLPSRHDNNFIRGAQQWDCEIAGVPLSIAGYLYAQQNGMTNVCAHVACRTAAARFHKHGDMTYREMNALVGIDHLTRTATDNGLGSAEMVKILESAGARCICGDYTHPDPKAPPWQKYVYGSIESGFPAIAIFATNPQEGHAIPLFGHTYNEDTWVPGAELAYFQVGSATQYIPSEQWVSTYVGHDDNWGSNYCIPRHFLHAQRHCQKPPPGPCQMESMRLAYVIATLPQKVKLNPIDAEVIGADYLFSILPKLQQYNQDWNSRLVFYAKNRRMVLRPILVTRAQYIQHLGRISDWNSRRIARWLLKALERALPDELFWMVELSVPELFSANRRKIGEVIIRAEKAASVNRDFSSFQIARLPGVFALYRSGGPAKPRFAFAPTAVDGHVELWGCEERQI